jgi:hypothetical protein
LYRALDFLQRQTIQHAKKNSAIAIVRLVGVGPRKRLIDSESSAVWWPQPSCPPGIRPIQLAARMKMKIVPKNQNVFSTRCAPMTLSRRS